MNNTGLSNWSSVLLCIRSADGNELCKYADDTYIIIPAVNVGSRSAELCNITDWAHKNNLKLNFAKSQEIIFVDKRKKAHFSAPAIMPELQRVQVLKVLGVTLTNGLSVSRVAQSCYSVIGDKPFMEQA